MRSPVGFDKFFGKKFERTSVRPRICLKGLFYIFYLSYVNISFFRQRGHNIPDMYQASRPKDKSNIDSPCIRHCCLDVDDRCLGCFRDLGEILIWGEADNKQRKQILRNCAERKSNKSGGLVFS